jgi:hypothetical protein
VTPWQESHFFQNIISSRVGSFTVDATRESGFIDWEWLAGQGPVEGLALLRHLRLTHRLRIRVNGHQNSGFILKPEAPVAP